MDWYESASEKHKKKEREKARVLRKSQWWKAQLASGVCYYCAQIFSPEELTMDHKIPVARGGRSNKGNVVPCCKQCNTEKRHKTPAELALEELKKS
ncbi:MAG: HNH endonuclease [Bdellovibrionales bacterium]|nr:HNH endonuclease [Bdellovibrionales bacterium]